MILSNTEQSITAEEFSEFEARFMNGLPPSFKSHYLVNNGGFPDTEFVKGENHIFSIDGFIPIKYGSLPIERLLREMPASLTKESFVPFANDAGGNIFILLLSGGGYGAVHLITADTSEMIYVCKSFGDFVAGME